MFVLYRYVHILKGVCEFKTYKMKVLDSILQGSMLKSLMVFLYGYVLYDKLGALTRTRDSYVRTQWVCTCLYGFVRTQWGDGFFNTHDGGKVLILY